MAGAHNMLAGFTRGWLDVSVLGYGIYLAFSATALWGGVFPFFPVEFRTAGVTFVFSISQALSFCVTILLCMTYSFFRPAAMRRMSVLVDVVPAFLGSTMLIAALYVPHLQEKLVVAAGVLLGVGSAGFAVMWQRYFSALPPEKGNYRLLIGTMCGSFIYFVLCLVPIAVTVYLVPLVLVPLCGLCVVLATRSIDFAQPIFEDVPSKHLNVYVRMVRDHWKSAVSIGSLGFASGLVRATAVSNPAMGEVIGLVTIVGSLAASAVMLAMWHRGTFRLDIRGVYLVVFPLVVCCLVAFPFFEVDSLYPLAGIIYMLFTLVTLVMLLQCVQISHDRGMAPLFVFGFFGSIVYLMQDAGIVFGYVSNMTVQFGYGNLFIVALAGMFVLSMSLYLACGKTHLGASAQNEVERIEFISLRGRTQGTRLERGERVGQDARAERAGWAADALREESSLPAAAEGSLGGAATQGLLREGTGESLREGVGKPLREGLEEALGESLGESLGEGHLGEGPLREPDERLQDRLSKRCRVIQERYRLTSREAQIMEMLARGSSMPRIAEVLVISENTVRTHAKHIYTKLDIHKRSELLELIEDDQA